MASRLPYRFISDVFGCRHFDKTRGALMYTDLLKASSVERLIGLIQSRYGLGLEVNFLSEPVMPNEGGSYFFNQGTLKVPLQMHEHYFGTAILKNASNLSDFDKSSLTNLIKMVLEPELYHHHLKMKAEQTTIDMGSLDNVEFMFPRNDEFFEEDVIETDAALFEGPTSLVSKVAHEAHDIRENWAFLPWNQIQDQVKGPGDIINLGASTIFVEEITDLSLNTQQMIRFCLQKAPKDDQPKPFFVFGSRFSFNEITQIQHMDQELCEFLKSRCLNLNRVPQGRQQMVQTLELFLEKAFEV